MRRREIIKIRKTFGDGALLAAVEILSTFFLKDENRISVTINRDGKVLKLAPQMKSKVTRNASFYNA